MRGKIPVLFVLLCFSAAYPITLPAILGVKEAGASEVSVLYTGDPFPGVTPYNSMQEDAFIMVTPIQACSMHYAGITTEDIYKSMRVYMPRGYRDYVDRYDVMILSDSNKGGYSPPSRSRGSGMRSSTAESVSSWLEAWRASGGTPD